MTYNKNELVRKIQSLPELSNEEKSALLELLRTHKKYGLVWEDKPEAIEERLRSELPVLKEVKERAIISDDPNSPNHIIIEGDNLEALVTLSYTHAGKIDVIYIDPPYNTGNKDFVYNDSYVDAEDGFRHSKWISFMSRRLRIVDSLLSEKGVIFISIDDNEQACLKLLCDEIFGEQCFVGDIAWQRTYSPRNDSKGISNEKEHILVYSNLPGWVPNPLPRDEKMDSKYSNPDGDERPWTSSDAFAPSAATHQGMVYAIQHPITGDLIYPYKGACWPLLQEKMFEEISKWGNYEYRDLHDADRRAAVCGIPESEVRQGVLGIVLSEPIEFASAKAMEIYKRGNWPKFYFTGKGRGGIRRKTYKDSVKGKIVTNLWPYEEVGHTDEAKKELAKFFGGEKPFDTPKPSRLIKRVLQISGDKDSIVLDFFAGSGTTLQAVMQLNAEDGGQRKCILVTNNENGICENVTYERNKKVITGYSLPKGDYVNGLSSNSLRYFTTFFVGRERTSKGMRELMNASTGLLCVKNDIYNEVQELAGRKLNSRIVRFFDNGFKKMLVIFQEEAIPAITELIASMDYPGRMLVYVFSPGNYPYEDEFAEVLDKVELCALPAAIYNAYRKVLPKKKVVKLPEAEDDGENLTTAIVEEENPSGVEGQLNLNFGE